MSLSDRVPVAAAVVFRLHLEGGRHGDKDVDGEGIDVVDDARGLLPVRVPLLFCLGVMISIAVAIAIVESRSGCCCCGVSVALGGKNVLAMLLIEDVSTLLMMLKDCCRSAFRRVTIAIGIAIVGSRSGCCCCGVPVVLGERTSW